MLKLNWTKIALPVLFIILSLPLSSASFAVYYGQIAPTDLGKLNKFGILIIPPTVDPQYVSFLSNTSTVVGYLSLATVGGWEPWANDLPGDIVMGSNGRWSEEIIDFSSPEWRSIILNRAIPYILSRGFDGVFLDNVDYVDVYPTKKEAMVELIRAIREHYPRMTIIVNRGFSIKEEIAPYVDYFLLEDFVSYYNFSTKRYEIFSKNDLEWEFGELKKLQTLHVSLLALSYVDLNNKTQIEEFSKIICSYAEEYNVSEVYLTDVSLQRIGINPCIRTTAPGQSTWGTSRTHLENPESKRKNKICGPAFVLLPIFILMFQRLSRCR